MNWGHLGSSALSFRRLHVHPLKPVFHFFPNPIHSSAYNQDQDKHGEYFLNYWYNILNMLIFFFNIILKINLNI